MKLASITFSYSLCPPAAFQGEMIEFLLFPFRYFPTIICDCHPPSFLKQHITIFQPLIHNIGCHRCASDVPRVHTKLKLVTGTYILQVNRVRFNQNEIDATCQICHQAEETLEYFVLDCTVLEPARQFALDAILLIAYELLDHPLERDHLLQLILDSSSSSAVLMPPSIKSHIEIQGFH